MVRIPVWSSVFCTRLSFESNSSDISWFMFFVDPNLSAEPQRNLVFFLSVYKFKYLNKKLNQSGLTNWLRKRVWSVYCIP